MGLKQQVLIWTKPIVTDLATEPKSLSWTHDKLSHTQRERERLAYLRARKEEKHKGKPEMSKGKSCIIEKNIGKWAHI